MFDLSCVPDEGLEWACLLETSAANSRDSDGDPVRGHVFLWFIDISAKLHPHCLWASPRKWRVLVVLSETIEKNNCQILHKWFRARTITLKSYLVGVWVFKSWHDKCEYCFVKTVVSPTFLETSTTSSLTQWYATYVLPSRRKNDTEATDTAPSCGQGGTVKGRIVVESSLAVPITISTQQRVVPR